jgi:hypothetical protein
MSQVWWFTTVIPDTQEVEKDHELEGSLGKVSKPCLKNEIKTKGLGHGSSGRALLSKKEALTSTGGREGEREKEEEGGGGGGGRKGRKEEKEGRKERREGGRKEICIYYTLDLWRGITFSR